MITPGILVTHEQLGVGKVLEINNDVATVVFMFFWPAVTVRFDALVRFVPSDTFKLVVADLSRYETMK